MKSELRTQLVLTYPYTVDIFRVRTDATIESNGSVLSFKYKNGLDPPSYIPCGAILLAYKNCMDVTRS